MNEVGTVDEKAPYHTIGTIPLAVEDEEARRTKEKAGASRRKQPLCYGLGSFRSSSRPRSMYSAEEPRFPRRLAFSFGRVPVGIVYFEERELYSLFLFSLCCEKGYILLQGV